MSTPKSGLSRRALLVNLVIKSWSGKARDKEAAETVVKLHRTKKGAGSYHKNLLPNSRELAEINNCAQHIRKYFYEQTLPWMSDGSRIISAKNHLNFTKKFREMKDEFEFAVEELINAYPRLQAEAQKILGDLYRQEEYPDQASMRKKFSCELNILPIPDVKDFRVDVSEAEKRDFLRKMKETESAAMKDAWGRLYESTKSVVERLSDPSTILRESLFEHTKEICDLLPSLNITNDPAMEKSCKEVRALLENQEVQPLRENKTERREAVKNLKNAMSKMGPFMKGATK